MWGVFRPVTAPDASEGGAAADERVIACSVSTNRGGGSIRATGDSGEEPTRWLMFCSVGSISWLDAGVGIVTARASGDASVS